MGTLKIALKILIILLSIGALVSGIALIISPEETANSLLHLGVYDNISINEMRGYLAGIGLTQGIIGLIGAIGKSRGTYYYLIITGLMAAMPVLGRLIDLAITPFDPGELQPILLEGMYAFIVLLYTLKFKNQHLNKIS